MTFRIEAYALTDVGLQRDHNEDAFDIISERGIYVVADGMGGHASGQVASSLAVENLRRYVLELADRAGGDMSYPVDPDSDEFERLLSQAIQWSNERIFIESMKDRKFEGMGTTIVCAMLTGEHLVLGHVGDSRIYRYRGGELEQVTRDHSLLNHYIDQGRITTEEEARNFRERNIIVKALGLKDYVEPTVETVDCQVGDVYLLCTDGLSDQVEDWVMASVLEGNEDLPEACQALIRLSNEAGGKDNCTVMLLRVLDADARVETGTQPSIPAMPDVDSEVDTAPDIPAPASAPPVEDPTLPDMPVFEAEESTDPQGVPVMSEDGEADFDDSDFNFDDRIDDPKSGRR